MASISSVSENSYQISKAPSNQAQQNDFVFVFNLQGNKSYFDQNIIEFLFNVTKHKSVVEFTYKQLENKLLRSQISRSLKKLAALFTVEPICWRINSTGCCEHNILRIQRVPDFRQIINHINKQ